MTLTPCVSLKLNELYNRWVGYQENQLFLKDALQKIISNTLPVSDPELRNFALSTYSTVSKNDRKSLGSGGNNNLVDNDRLHGNLSSPTLAQHQQRSGGSNNTPPLKSSRSSPRSPRRQTGGVGATINGSGNLIPNVTRPRSVPSSRSSKESGRSSVETSSMTRLPRSESDEKRSSSQAGRDSYPLSEIIPPFYFPNGRPLPTDERSQMMTNLKELFCSNERSFSVPGQIRLSEMDPVCSICGVSLYWRRPLFIYAGGTSVTDKNTYILQDDFLRIWGKLISRYHDESSRFVEVLANQRLKSSSTDSSINNRSANNQIVDNDIIPMTTTRKSSSQKSATTPHSTTQNQHRSYLIPDDFTHLLQDVIDTHPGLQFLGDTPHFHSKYIDTVTARIFYVANRSWSGRLTVNELRRSQPNFLTTLALLTEEEDINMITDFFSYEHFYVLYCKFWDIDYDHDYLVNQQDFLRNEQAVGVSDRIIDRIFSGAVFKPVTNVQMLEGGTKGINRFPVSPNSFDNSRLFSSPVRPSISQIFMTYPQYVWFKLSEEDKTTPTSIEYWFRCMDLDGDGFLSMYEMNYFYEEQRMKMEEQGVEPIEFTDLLCSILDMVKPKIPEKISLSDLKRFNKAPTFFNTFINLEKYLIEENCEPQARALPDVDSDQPPPTDWEKYATEEYEALSTEECMGEQNSGEMYDDDDEYDLNDLGIITTSINDDADDFSDGDTSSTIVANCSNNKNNDQKTMINTVDDRNEGYVNLEKFVISSSSSQTDISSNITRNNNKSDKNNDRSKKTTISRHTFKSDGIYEDDFEPDDDDDDNNLREGGNEDTSFFTAKTSTFLSASNLKNNSPSPQREATTYNSLNTTSFKGVATSSSS